MLSALLPVSNSVLTKRGKGKSRKRVCYELQTNINLTCIIFIIFMSTFIQAHEEIDDHPVLSKITFPNKDLLQIIPVSKCFKIKINVKSR